jgi:hypothetical protein
LETCNQWITADFLSWRRLCLPSPFRRRAQKINYELSGKSDHQQEEKANMDFLKDLWGFLKHRKKFWLLPIIVIMLIFAALLVLGGSGLAPFIYTLF